MLVLVIDDVTAFPRFGYGATIDPVEPTEELKHDLMKVPATDIDKITRAHFVKVDVSNGWAVFREQSNLDPDPVQAAIAIALKYGLRDGGHHKMWVIDQMLRTLAGNRYEQLVAVDEDDVEWDAGTAP